MRFWKADIDKPAWSEAVVLKRGTARGRPSRRLVFSCLRHLASNEDAVRKRDGEGIHQMRVGLRRLRAAISIFKGILQDRQSETIKAELKWLTEQLVVARDYDVFLEDSVASKCNRSPGKWQHSTRFCCSSGTSGLQRPGMLSRASGIAGSSWAQPFGWPAAIGADIRTVGAARRRARSAKDMAREILTKRTKKIVKKIKVLETLDAAHRHKLRIAIKKLRYATEFFDTLFAANKKERKALSKALEKLQSAMGKPNDIRVHESLVNDIVCQATIAKHRETSLAVDLVKKKDQKSIKPLLAAAAKAGGRLARLQPFWK